MSLRKRLHPRLHALRHPSPPCKLCPRRTLLKNVHGSHHVDWCPHAILVPLALLVHVTPYVLARIIHPGCTTLFAVNPGILPPVLSHPSMHGCTEAMPQACPRVLYCHWPACAPMCSGTLHTPDVLPTSPKSLLRPMCASRTSAVRPGCTISGCTIHPHYASLSCRHITVMPAPDEACAIRHLALIHRHHTSMLHLFRLRHPFTSHRSESLSHHASRRHLTSTCTPSHLAAVVPHPCAPDTRPMLQTCAPHSRHTPHAPCPRHAPCDPPTRPCPADVPTTQPLLDVPPPPQTCLTMPHVAHQALPDMAQL